MYVNKFLVSACLLGQRVRYDGATKHQDDPVLQAWLEAGSVVPFCPEVAGGLAVPRAAAEIERGDARAVLEGSARVLTQAGVDVTAPFLRGAARALAICREHRIDIAVMTDKSPSCGSSKVYLGRFNGNSHPGTGLTVMVLRAAGIAVFNQHQFVAAESALQLLDS